MNSPGNRASHGCVRGRNELAGVGLDAGVAGHARGDAGRMNQRRAGARQVLHAQEHPELLRGGRHQHGLALPLARLERDAGVAHLARQQQRLEIGQRLVDHDRPQPRRLVHDVGAILLQVARGRLLDVEDAVEPVRRRLADAAQELQQVSRRSGSPR